MSIKMKGNEGAAAATAVSTNITREKKSLSPFRWYSRLEHIYATQDYKANPHTTIVFSQDMKKASGDTCKHYTFAPYSIPLIKKITDDNAYMYEVLSNKLPRRFYMDIDIKPFNRDNQTPNPAYKKHTYDEILQATIKLVQHILHACFNITDPIDPNQVNCFVVKDTTTKQSLHIIFPVYLKDVQDTKFFAQILKHQLLISPQLPEDIRHVLVYNNEPIIDFAVYSCNQNFRLPFNSKIGKDDLILEPIKKSPTLPNHLVGIYKADHTDIPFISSTTLASQGIDAVTALQDQNFQRSSVYNKLTQKEKHNFAAFNYDVFSHLQAYDNLDPNTLDLKQEDIPFLLSCIPNSNTKPQHFVVWQAIGQTLKNLSHNSPKKSQQYLDYWIKWSNQAAQAYPNEAKACKEMWTKMTVRAQRKWGFRFLTTLARFYYPNTLFDKYEVALQFNDMFNLKDTHMLFDTIDIYDDQRYMKPFDVINHDLIAVEGPMGAGKTHQIKALDKQLKPKRILMVGCRQTFCREKVADFKSVWPDIRYYKDPEVQHSCHWVEFPKLVIQVESLRHLICIDQDTSYDLLILDEIESILYQFFSQTQTEPYRCFEIFMQLLTTSKKIVMADAFLSNRTISIIQHLKTLRPDIRCKLDINKFNPNSHITANILGIATNPSEILPTKARFTQHIIAQLKQNKKLCIVCSSKTFKQDIINKAIQTFGQEYSSSILHYDGDTDDMAIEDLGNVQDKWSNPHVRMVIYTTKITVGISFDVPNAFHSIYIYGSVTCPIVRDLMQSHFRVRHTIDNTIYIAMNTCKLPESSTQEEEMTLAYAKNILQTIKSRFRKFEDTTENASYRIAYETIIQYNLLEDKLGYSLYHKLFTYFLQKIGYTINDTQPQDEVIVIDDDCKNDIFPPNYIKDYIKFRDTTNAEIEEIERRKKASTATTQDKLVSSAFFFYKSVIKKTKLYDPSHQLEQELCDLLGDTSEIIKTRASALDHTFLEQVECDMFNAYHDNVQFKKHAMNIIAEMTTKEIDESYNNTKKKNIHDQKDTVRLDYITQLKDLLGLDSSFDTSKSLTSADMKTFLKYYTRLDMYKKMELHELFCITLKNKTRMSGQQAESIIEQMIVYWNGSSFEKQKIKVVQGKRLYGYHLRDNCPLRSMLKSIVISK